MNKYIIYLASGNSRRFGSNKLFYEIEGKPMYKWGLETIGKVEKKQNNCQVIVVSRYEEIRKFAESNSFTAVDSPESEKGVSYTIKSGINVINNITKEDYLLFVVADQPYLTEKTVVKILNKADEGVECASLCFGDIQGNPGLFSAKLINELMALEGDTGGRGILKRHNCAFVEATSLKELEDIDTE